MGGTKVKKINSEIKRELSEKGDAIRKHMIDEIKQNTKIYKGERNIISDNSEPSDINYDPYRIKDAYYIKTDEKYKYKQKTLLFASRGISAQGRQLLKDLKLLLPHHKSESKWEKKVSYSEINELCELSDCSSVIFLEAKKSEMMLWVAKTPYGPTIKSRITNIHTLKDSTFFGNCLARSRPLLTFDKNFSTFPHLKLIQTLFTQIFGTPNKHPKSMPFHDHCLSFFYFDNCIYMRNYQISPENEHTFDKPDKQILTEIGPQFVLDVVLILNGSFNGITLWRNPQYISSLMLKKYKMAIDAEKYKSKQFSKKSRENDLNIPEDELSNSIVFAAP